MAMILILRLTTCNDPAVTESSNRATLLSGGKALTGRVIHLSTNRKTITPVTFQLKEKHPMRIPKAYPGS